MADNDSLSWEIEKIVDCKGNNMIDDGWVRINPMSGKGNTNAQISVTPSSYWNDCKEAVVTISASTGDKKYITINRCNPECNCDALTFIPYDVSDKKIPSSGGTLDIAEYSMSFCCDGKKSISLVNVDGDCDYEIEETVDDENPCNITGIITAVVGENESNVNEKNFSYYVTYNGIRCDKIPLVENAFAQKRTKSPCEDALCPTATIEGTNNVVPQIGGQRQVIFSDEYKTLGCWEIANVVDNNGNRGFSYGDGPDDTLLLFFDTNETYVDKTYDFTFVLINNTKGDECDIQADKIIVQKAKVKPIEPTCDTCQDVNIGLVFEKTLPAVIDRSKQTYSIVDLDAECQPNSMRFVHKSGAKIIKNTGNLRITGEINVITSYNNINDNDNITDRTEIIEYYINNETTVCGTFSLHQEGVQSTSCKILVDSITSSCNQNRLQRLEITAKKSNYQCDNVPLIYYIENTTVTGKIDNISSTDYLTYSPIIDPELETGNYNVIWYNEIDRTNSGRFNNVHIEACNTVKARIMFKADNGSYINVIDNLFCFFAGVISNDIIERIEFDKDKWFGIDVDGIHNRISRSGHIYPEDLYCNEEQNTYQIHLDNDNERYTAIYQDVDIDLSDLNVDEYGNISGSLYIVELCTEDNNCGCRNSSLVRLQLKKYDESSSSMITPGVNWYESESQGNPYSYAGFADENGNVTNKHRHLTNVENKYERRICFKITGMKESDFHTVTNPESVGYNAIILINMYPDTASNNG